ncbi:conserved hypothetical protein [Phenylobacterium zucineum HLK1]|uniref:Thioredoxin domain-containing protein n=1 Tax=Phenylobacterium zucineum (strain HLK1) TaxID=450851 RepID=B4RGJ6_PHEZH|nr:thioredoxin family protein [Phenylobacterium zucineum]ACG78902.1 conserved hypothetical protein [Phenylobacterium zucineum HLK1]
MNAIPIEEPAAAGSGRRGGRSNPAKQAAGQRGAAGARNAFPQTITDGQLSALLAEGRGTLLIDVSASSSGLGRTMDEQFRLAAKALRSRVRMLTIDVHRHPAAAIELSVNAFPTLILLRGGQAIARHAGVMSAEMIVNWTRQALADALRARRTPRA